MDVVLKYSGEMLEDDGNDFGEMDDAGDKLNGEHDTTLEFFLESMGDFKLIREGEVFFLNSLIAGEEQGEV